MVPTREIAELVDAVLAAEGKVVLVGDHRQLPELQAGGTFRAFVQRGLALELRNNVRQVNAWERDALDQLRDGEPEHALDEYLRHDRITIEPTADATRARSSGLVRRRRTRRDHDDRPPPSRRGRPQLPGARADARCWSTRSRTRHSGWLVRRRRLRRCQAQRATARHQQRRPRPCHRSRPDGRRDRDRPPRPAYPARPALPRRAHRSRRPAARARLRHHRPHRPRPHRRPAYVLAIDGIDREWAYVALSRGRRSNRLYLSAEADNDRAEYAPAGPALGPLERLARQLERSSAQVLAIDTGQPVDSVSLEQATLERQRLEHRRFGWLPGRRQELEAARAHEADVRRERLERQHGGRPFATDAEWRERLDSQHERELERATERVLRRERGMRREL